MNLELVDPFTKNVPDKLDSELAYPSSEAVSCLFNRRGSYLAVGYVNGDVVIWDFMTRGIARVIPAHTRPVVCLSWARHGREILTAGLDKQLQYWSLEPKKPELRRSVQFDSAVLLAAQHPRVPCRAFVCLDGGDVVVLDLATGAKTALALPSLPVVGACIGAAEDAGASPPIPMSDGNKGLKAVAVCTAAYTACGERLYLGTEQGRVVAVGAEDLRVQYHFKVDNVPQVRQIVFSGNRQWVLVHGQDRVMKLLSAGDAKGRVVREFQQTVDRPRWQSCCFSGDSEHVVGGTREDYKYKLYVWDVAGHWLHFIDGAQYGLLGMSYHPVRPFIAAASSAKGHVQVWGTDRTANWTGFAADFQELQENIQYEEREDEFDKVPGEESEKLKRQREVEDQHVDVVTLRKVAAFSSDSEDEDSIFYLPTEPGEGLRLKRTFSDTEPSAKVEAIQTDVPKPPPFVVPDAVHPDKRHRPAVLPGSEDTAAVEPSSDEVKV